MNVTLNKAIIAVAAVLMAVLCLHAIIYKAPAIEQDILSRITQAVQPLNAKAEIAVNGRSVMLRGPEADAASKAKTLAAANAVWGALETQDGLWITAAAQNASFLTAEKMPGGGVRLTGDIADAETRKAIVTAAEQAFPGAVEDHLAVRPGAGAIDVPGLAAGLKALVGLDTGFIVASTDRLRLSGSAASEAGLETAKAVASANPQLWQIYVTPPSPDQKQAGEPAPSPVEQVAAVPPAEPAPAPEVPVPPTPEAAAQTPQPNTPRVVGPVTNFSADTDTEKPAQVAAAPVIPEPAVPDAAQACNQAVSGLLSNTSISFESKSADITPDGNALIEKLVKAAEPCTSNTKLKVVIGGYTDNVGSDEDNLRLSQQRANAVKTALGKHGVKKDAITAFGFGEAMPIATNTTEEGRQTNRRITIEWLLR